MPLKRGVDFVGFRNYPFEKLLRVRNVGKMRNKILLYKRGEICFSELFESFRGWRSYAKWSDSEELEKEFKEGIIEELWNQI